MAVLIMAHRSITPTNANNNNKNSNSVCKSSSQTELASPKFHDFLGMKLDIPVNFGSKTADSRLSEASLGASSGGGRGPISTTSDMGSAERQVGNHLEGVPFYNRRSDISGPEISNKIVGSKRSNSDSAFMGSYRDEIPQLAPDSLENSHLIKILRNGASGERSRRSNDGEVLFSTLPLRPNSTSLVFQPPSRLDADVSKWERSISMNMSPSMQYTPRGSQFVPCLHQVTSNKFRDSTAGPSNISHSAADEGSRTGIKGPEILSSINASERNSSVMLPNSSKQKCGTNIVGPESSIPQSRHGPTSASRQMTIFYGGQAHVFDDVHPNKADVIMALAGSNGGSWSTSYSPESTTRSLNESLTRGGETEAGITGAHPSSITGISKDARKKQVQAADAAGIMEQKREL